MFFGEQHKHKPALPHNVVNIAVKEPSERLAPAAADSGLFFSFFFRLLLLLLYPCQKRKVFHPRI